MADATSSSPSRSLANAELALPRSDVESQLSSLLYATLRLYSTQNADLSHRVQAAMEDMLKMINEIDQNSSDVMDDIKNCMDFALERKRILDEEKEHYQKAAYTVISMLNNQVIS